MRSVSHSSFPSNPSTSPQSRFVPTPANPAVSRDIKTDVDFSELKNLVYIASGEFANVFTGTWGDKRIAVKILKEEVRRGVNDFDCSLTPLVFLQLSTRQP